MITQGSHPHHWTAKSVRPACARPHLSRLGAFSQPCAGAVHIHRGLGDRPRLPAVADLPLTDRTRLTRLPALQTRDTRALHDVLDAGLVAHARDGDRLLLHGSTGAGLLRRAAAAAPLSVAVTVLDGLVFARSLYDSSMNYRSAVVFGRAAPVRDGEKLAGAGAPAGRGVGEGQRRAARGLRRPAARPGRLGGGAAVAHRRRPSGAGPGRTRGRPCTTFGHRDHRSTVPPVRSGRGAKLPATTGARRSWRRSRSASWSVTCCCRAGGGRR